MEKATTFLISTVLILTLCNYSHNEVSVVTHTATNTKAIHPRSSIDKGDLFTLADAEKILGEKAHLIDSSSKNKGEAVKYVDSISIIKKEASAYRCGYMANSKDKESGKTGVVYFVFEQYPQISSAKKVYLFYKTANKNVTGFKEPYDIGNEAWFGSNPLFVYVRKGDKIFVLKVNKMTSKTSSTEFNLIAKKIAVAL